MTREPADQPGGALRDLVLPGPDHRPGGGAGVVGGDRTDLAAQSVAPGRGKVLLGISC